MAIRPRSDPALPRLGMRDGGSNSGRCRPRRPVGHGDVESCASAPGGQGRGVDEGDRVGDDAPKIPRTAASCRIEVSMAARSPRTSTTTWLGTPPATAVRIVPSRDTSGIHGWSSSATGPAACTFTASGTKSPRSASLTDRATAVPALSCASLVDAPRCGVSTVFGAVRSGLSGPSGSLT